MAQLKAEWHELWFCDGCGELTTYVFFADTHNVTPPVPCKNCGKTITGRNDCHEGGELVRLYFRAFTKAIDKAGEIE